MALTFTPLSEMGQKLPSFRLPTVDGKWIQSSDLTKGPLLVMFICNHCPYVKAIEDRLIQLGKDLKEQNIPVLAIASNDSKEYPEDNFENLKKRWTEKAYPFPYLFDEDQSVAKNFGAVCTPDFFLYNSDLNLAYRGRLDDSWKDPSKVTRRELFEAAMSLKNGASHIKDQTPSMGCNIKWISSND